MLRYGIKQQMVPHYMLACLKGVVLKKSQVDCGQAFHSVV